MDKSAEELHKNVPPDWYFRSIRENVLQRYWHKRRFEAIGEMVEKTDGRILDIGCADGVFTRLILEKSKAERVVGVDVLKKSVDWAKKHWKKNRKLEFRVANAHDLPFEKDSFDAVFALEVLEHVHEPENVLDEIKRVLKKDGYAVFLVPTDSLLFETIWFFWTKFRGKIWEEAHIQSYKKDGLAGLCRRKGFKIEKEKKFLLGMLEAIKVRKR